ELGLNKTAPPALRHHCFSNRRTPNPTSRPSRQNRANTQPDHSQRQEQRSSRWPIGFCVLHLCQPHSQKVLLGGAGPHIGGSNCALPSTWWKKIPGRSRGKEGTEASGGYLPPQMVPAGSAAVTPTTLPCSTGDNRKNVSGTYR